MAANVNALRKNTGAVPAVAMRRPAIAGPSSRPPELMVLAMPIALDNSSGPASS